MKLVEKFETWLNTNPRKEIRAIQCEGIAEEFAIGFYEWRSTTPTKNINQYTNKEALEIYKKENEIKN